MDSSTKNIRKLVLDAGPLITQSASSLQQYAQEYFTTPGVHSELKDEYSRQQLILWGDSLKIRHPKMEYIRKVESFAKLTGDYAVLSANDIHIIALAYELEVEANNGDWRLRKFPGEKLEFAKKASTQAAEVQDSTPAEAQEAPKKKRTRRGGKKQREKREAQLQKELEEQDESAEASEEPAVTPEHPKASEPAALEPETQPEQPEQPETQSQSSTDLEEDYDDEDDDGEWITPENLQEEMLKDNNEQVQERKQGPVVKVALTTGDFACQNVAMQVGLNLMNSMSGKQIKRIRNYMYRCHACFRLTPIPKSGKPKHFCPKCGGETLLRCAVSVDNVTGKITPHLKSNFQWIKRGTKFSLPSPLSKNQIRLQGNSGYQHNKQNRHKSLQTPLILREDQKEYHQAVKDDEWQRRQNDKVLQEWIGGGSADNYISPFNSFQSRASGVKVGRSRYTNSSKGKGK